MVSGLSEVSGHFADILESVGDLPGKMESLNAVIAVMNEGLQIANSITSSISKVVNFIFENNLLRKILGATEKTLRGY